MSLNLLLKEMHNVSNLYNSHRLYVYLSCMNIFHRLFVEKEESLEPDAESFEDIFDKVEKIFKTAGTMERFDRFKKGEAVETLVAEAAAAEAKRAAPVKTRKD